MVLFCLLGWFVLGVFDTGRTQANAADSSFDPDIRQLWKSTVAGRASTPIVSHGFVYVISRQDEKSDKGYDGTLYAISPGGSIIWQRYLPNAPASPASDQTGSTIYIADGDLKALDAKTGEVAWSFLPVGDTIKGVPIVRGNQIYVTSDLTQTVYAIDDKGALLWKEHVGTEGKLSPIAFAANGTMVVANSVQNEAGDPSDPLAQVYYDQFDAKHAMQYTTTLYAYDKDGFALWQTKLDGVEAQTAAPVTFEGGYAIGKEALYILDADGVILHAPTERSSANAGEVSAFGKKLYYPVNNSMIAYDSKGKETSTYRIPSPFGHVVEDAYGRALIWQENGWLAMMNADGSLRILYKPVTELEWSHATASVALDEDGTIYTAYMDGADGEYISHILALKDANRPVMSSAEPESPSKAVSVRIDGKPLKLFADPMIVRGSVYLPLRELFDALGAKVTYDGISKRITASRGSMKLVYRIGDLTAKINGRTVSLDAPGKIVQGRTMVPLRFVSKSLGFKVQWDAESKIVQIHI